MHPDLSVFKITEQNKLNYTVYLLYFRCIHPLKRSLTFSGVSLYQSSALLVTKDGEAFIAHVKPRIKKKSVGKFYKHYIFMIHL